MIRPSIRISNDSPNCKRVTETLSGIKATVLLLHRSNQRLRRIVVFQAFALAVAFAGLVSLADWRVTAAFYVIALLYLPFFARR